MNAYELADELWEKYLDNNECQHGYSLSNGCHNNDCKEQALYDSATMLRQQADRIAELEQAIKDADEWLESGEGVSLCYYSFSDSNPKSIKIIQEITG